jgi:hypothetical protein
MGATARFGLQYIDRGQPMRDTRAQLQANAESIERTLENIQGFVASYVAASGIGQGWSQTFIGLDTDGTPYVNPAGVTQPVRIGLDTDGTPYVINWSVT